MNRLPALDRQEDLDAVAELFRKASIGEALELLREATDRVEKLGTGTLIAVLFGSRGHPDPAIKKAHQLLRATVEGELLQTMSQKSVNLLLRGL